ncbi:MAG: PAS domain S-box protein [Mucilaginibacter sp.]
MKSPTLPPIFSPSFLYVKLKPITITGFLSIITGTLVLIGWVFDVAILQTVLPQFASMKFNTAIEFVLLGFALLLTPFQVKRSYRIVSLVLCLLVIVLSFTSLIETIFQFNSGIDQLFIADITSINLHLPYPGRMSPITATCFVLLGFSFLGLATKSNLTHVISQYLLNFVTAISTIALIGYLYGLSVFYSQNYTGSVSIHTAVLLFFASLTASWLHPAIGINKLFEGKKVGNVMAKRLLIIAVCLTLFFGISTLIGQHFKLFSFSDGISILLICFIGAAFIMVWYMAKWINKLDKGRSDAETQVILMNEQLEVRVQQRSAKLITLLAKFRESEARFKAAFEHSAIGMALVSLKGKWLQVNRSLCDLLGYKEHELLSISFENIRGDKKITYPNLENELLPTGENSGRIEKRYRCKDKSIVWISINTATVTNRKGGAVYFVSQFEDITKRKNAEISLKAAYKDIENHVKIIQNVSWKQSHLMRRPLANLMSLTFLLKNNHSDKNILNHIESELNALDKIIIEMAEDAVDKGVKQIVVKRRSFKKAS